MLTMKTNIQISFPKCSRLSFKLTEAKSLLTVNICYRKIVKWTPENIYFAVKLMNTLILFHAYAIKDLR